MPTALFQDVSPGARLENQCPAGSLEVTVKVPAQVDMYTFGTRTTQFHICATCGIVPVATSEVDGRLYAVVNVNTFDGVDASLIGPATAGALPGVLLAESAIGHRM